MVNLGGVEVESLVLAWSFPAENELPVPAGQVNYRIYNWRVLYYVIEVHRWLIRARPTQFRLYQFLVR